MMDPTIGIKSIGSAHKIVGLHSLQVTNKQVTGPD